MPSNIVGGGGECYDSSNDLGAQSAFPDFGTELVFPDLKTKSDVTHKQAGTELCQAQTNQLGT